MPRLTWRDIVEGLAASLFIVVLCVTVMVF